MWLNLIIPAHAVFAVSRAWQEMFTMDFYRSGCNDGVPPDSFPLDRRVSSHPRVARSGTGVRSGIKALGISSFVTSERPLHLWEPQFLICIMGITLFTWWGRSFLNLGSSLRSPRRVGGALRRLVPSHWLAGTAVLLLLGETCLTCVGPWCFSWRHAGRRRPCTLVPCPGSPLWEPEAPSSGEEETGSIPVSAPQESSSHSACEPEELREKTWN